LATQPTLSLAEIILRDSAKIHEEDAKKANTEEYTKHRPALPFYTEADVVRTLSRFQAVEKDTWIWLAEGICCRFRHVGHILGATFIELEIEGKRFVFSGDIGRTQDPLLLPPESPNRADYLFLESTYGDRLHPEDDVETLLEQLVQQTVRNRGTLIIPSFAVERLQLVMLVLHQLYLKNRIPNIAIYIDSPMGNSVFEVFRSYPNWHTLDSAKMDAMERHMNIITSYKDTWAAIDDPRPKIVVAGSGMITGGRVLTYLQQCIDNPTTSILLVGYQAEGTRGRKLLDGAEEIKFFGKYYPVKATIHHIDSLSAHADQNELLSWIDTIENTPEEVFLVHGEGAALEALRVKIKDKKGWRVSIPKLNSTRAIPFESPK
jgi:metallo-beta-lactamase family protein